MLRPGQDGCGSRGIDASLSTAERDFHSPILGRGDDSFATATVAQVTSNQSTATFPPPFTAAERRGEGDRHASATSAARASHHLPRQERDVAMAHSRPRRLDDSARSSIGDIAPPLVGIGAAVRPAGLMSVFHQWTTNQRANRGSNHLFSI